MVLPTITQVLYTAADITAVVTTLAKQIDKDWSILTSPVLNRTEDNLTPVAPAAQSPQPHSLTLVVVMNGAWHFASALSLALKTPHQVAFIQAKSYAGTQQTELPTLAWWHPPQPNQHLLVVEDIVDTGHTLATLQNHLGHLDNAIYWKTVSLLDKPLARQTPVQLDYTGFTVEPGQFVVGFGLDVDQHYRDLPFIGLYSQ